MTCPRCHFPSTGLCDECRRWCLAVLRGQVEAECMPAGAVEEAERWIYPGPDRPLAHAQAEMALWLRLHPRATCTPAVTPAAPPAGSSVRVDGLPGDWRVRQADSAVVEVVGSGGYRSVAVGRVRA